MYDFAYAKRQVLDFKLVWPFNVGEDHSPLVQACTRFGGLLRLGWEGIDIYFTARTCKIFVVEFSGKILALARDSWLGSKPCLGLDSALSFLLTVERGVSDGWAWLSDDW